MSVAVIIVTYNRKEELVRAVKAVIKQSIKIDQLYIIDNHSSDGTRNYINTLGLVRDNWMTYIYLPKNIGGAGGFCEGLKLAHSRGYDYYIMMDDDGRPVNEDSFLNLINAAHKLNEQNYRKLMLNAIVTYDPEHEKLSFGLNGLKTYSEVKKEEKGGLYLSFINPFNGTLISNALVDDIGYPNKDFFIRGDDVDYQERAKSVGAYLATVVNSLYYHPTFGLFPMKWKHKTIYVANCNEWKSYYQVRNYIYRYKRDAGIIAALKEYFFQCYCAKKCNPEYEKCKPFMKKGLIDGLKGKLGRVIEPGQTTL